MPSYQGDVTNACRVEMMKQQGMDDPVHLASDDDQNDAAEEEEERDALAEATVTRAVQTHGSSGSGLRPGGAAQPAGGGSGQTPSALHGQQAGAAQHQQVATALPSSDAGSDGLWAYEDVDGDADRSDEDGSWHVEPSRKRLKPGQVRIASLCCEGGL